MKMPTLYFLILLELLHCHSAQAKTDTMRLFFDGDVIATPCRLVSSNQVEVNFGSKSVSQVNESGRLRGDDIVIKLAQCPVVTTSITAQLMGEPDSIHLDFYKNQGSAKNIAISIYDPLSLRYLDNGAAVTTSVLESAADRTAEFKWEAWVETPQQNATEGTINGVVTVNLTYQ
ncbi:fimbrial protein [Aeromonas salmonicida]|uniref:fimbrial protein n=1 Tax=Aeromonas salmonicida TaxID=645 RepID=UPI002796A71B|nr:fimbrial protein [Aeromonas salmonicida]MDQ1884171.1 fimbrial protein [Aeromonas salmonicida]